MLNGRHSTESGPNRLACSLAAVGLCVALVGCGNGLAQVQGTVSLDGEQVFRSDTKQCNITFVPASGGGAKASGSVDENGVYELSTGANKGIEPGEYVAAVRVRDITPPGDQGGYPISKTVSPAHYGNPAKSGLQFTVDSGSNTIDFDLSSADQ